VPIRWSALKVQEATEMAEDFVKQLKEPVESIKIVAQEAQKIDNIPDYISQSLISLVSECDRVIGGVTNWSEMEYDGSFDKIIERIRRDIPAEALASERKAAAVGTKQNLL
jgi:hypothetical protein